MDVREHGGGTPPPTTAEDPESIATALGEISDAFGEIYKQIALINRRVGYIEEHVKPAKKAVTLVRLPRDSQE